MLRKHGSGGSSNNSSNSSVYYMIFSLLWSLLWVLFTYFSISMGIIFFEVIERFLKGE